MSIKNIEQNLNSSPSVGPGPMDPECSVPGSERGMSNPDARSEGSTISARQEEKPFTNTEKVRPLSTSQETSSEGSCSTDLPAQKPEKPQSASQWGIRRILIFTVYRILFSVVFLTNIAAAIALLVRQEKSRSHSLVNFTTAATANLTVAILIRQPYIINGLYDICRFALSSAPLRVRYQFAYLYEFGGVHSGSAVCSVIWFIIFTVYLTKESVKGNISDPALLVLNYLLLSLLLSIVITALPQVRYRYHNAFENVHRFAGWSALALFWVYLALFAKSTNAMNKEALGYTLIKLPAFWFLIIASIHAIYPWMMLRRIPVRAERLSKHVLRLHHTKNVSRLRGFAISDAPLREWHTFACIPARDGERGGSMIIANAGDWTRKTINNPRSYYYVRGIPSTGLLSMALMFKRVVIVATGSGIGPCLAVMFDLPKSSCRVIWSTPAPEATFGKELISDVKEVDPDAIIYDTTALGRPDLVQMAYDLYISSGSDAVFCISNKTVTGKVLLGLRGRGVHAYGPIWDS
ncbi:Adenylate-forming reductase [Cladobotryum mycophilum]|uniref:Adenylate-forming reductase n=1 Tax=Cladobotryum mycophilum TaxID=491253 RepID=A0ABR0SPE2_9HYPO